MSNNVIPIDTSSLPQEMRDRIAAGRSVGSAFTSGVRSAINVLSIKGKVFTVRTGGVPTRLDDPQTRAPYQHLDVVLVNASPHISKTYYAHGYIEGDNTAPDCWSLDGIKPDASVINKVNPTCPNCPNNVFGSRITEAGKQAKLCADSRRVALISSAHLGLEQPLLLMLRVPATSLGILRDYALYLQRNGADTNAVVTRLTFDFSQAFPKLLFHYVRTLTPTEYKQAATMADDPATAGILVAPDFDTAQPAKIEPVQPNDRLVPLAEMPQVIPTGVTATPDLLTVVKNTLVQLPDGQWFDEATGEYVEPPAAKVETPQLDPDTIKLPENRYFNKRLKAFVEGPEVGAKAVEAPTMPTKPARSRAKKVEEPAKQEQVVPSTPAETKPAEEPKPVAEVKAESKQTVGAAPAELEALIKSMTPPQQK